MPRPRNTDERRRQIVEGMRSAVARHGYEGATIARIAKAARLTPGLVHYHFADKSEIAVALLDRLAQVVDERGSARIASARTDRARIDAVVDAFLGTGNGTLSGARAADSDSLACWIALAGEATRRPAIHRAYRRHVESAIERLASMLPPPASTRRRDAAAIFAAIQGFALLSGAAPDSIPPGTAAASVKRMIDGLAGATGGGT